MYRGYIQCNGKQSVEKFKDVKQLHTIDEVKGYASYAGVLDGSVIMVDVDDRGQSEALYQVILSMGVRCSVLRTTRGRHFYFKVDGNEKMTCKTGVNLLCGITADIKVGTNSYDCLKVDGVERRWEMQHDFDMDRLPKWLTVGGKSLYGLRKGDGRNDRLFGQIIPLQHAGCTKDEIKALYPVLNSHVLQDPLSVSELAVVLRDEAFIDVTDKDTKKKKDNKYCPYDVAMTILQGNDIFLGENILFGPDGILKEKQLRQIIWDTENRLTSKGVVDVETILRTYAPVQKFAPANIIRFSNGTYDINTDSWVETSDIVPIVFPTRYISTAYNEVVDKTLDKIACYDPEVRSNIEEMIGYCLLRDCRLRKGFILYGNKRNGKSTLLRAIIKLLGEDNITTMDMNAIGRQFSTASLQGICANIGDDISSEYITDSSMIKKVISGEYLSADRKFKDTIQFRNFAKLIFSANDLTRFKDDTGAMLDRLIVIPCLAEFNETDTDYNPNIENDMTTDSALEYLMKLAVEGLRRILYMNCFTPSIRSQQLKDEYAVVVNPILDFFGETEGPEDGQETQQYFNSYLQFCVKANLSPLSRIGFTRMVCSKYGVKTRQVRDGKGWKSVFMVRKNPT